MRTSGLTLAAAREGWCVGIRWNHVSGWRILAKFSVTMLVSNDLLMFDNIFIAHMNTPGLIGPCGANWRRGCFVCIAVRCGSSWVINLLMHQMCRIWWIIWTLRPFSESTSLSDVAQVKSTVSPKKTILNNVLSILQPAIIIIICKIVSVSFWILPCLSTPLKKNRICGRWFNGVRWHLWQGDCTWSLLTWMNARDPCGKPLTRMVWSSENFNRLIQLIESDCSYVFYVMWCVLFTLHDIWLASNECTKMHLVSSWRTSNGQLMGSCSETSQQILCSCDRMCLSDCKGEPSYDWNVLLGSTFFLGFQLSAMNQVTERWEVICSDDDGLTCSGNSSSIRRWEKNTWRHASWSCVCLEPLCRFRLHL